MSALVVVPRLDLGQHALRSGAAFVPGDRVCDVAARVVLAEPTFKTLQRGADEHIRLAPESLEFTNHSCEPNIFFDLVAGSVLALRPIAPGDELTCFYPSTEWDMARPFTCGCGTPSCIGEVRGARFLPVELLPRYGFSQWIIEQLQLR